MVYDLSGSAEIRIFPLLLMMREFLKMTCEANAAGENSSFIFTVDVKSIPHYHFKLAHVALHIAVKEFFETHL